MRAPVAMALTLALLVPACAGGPRIPLSRLAGWHAVQAGGTRLIGDLSPEEMQSLAGDLLRFDAIFSWLVGWPSGADTNPLSIYLFRSREIAARFGLGRGGGGWALPGLDESFLTMLISSGRDEDRSLLFHEYTHVLLARNRRSRLPRWYHEGLATYFSTVSWRDGAVVVGAAPGTHAAWVMGRGAMPLDRLFDGSIVDMDRKEIHDFYATAWALSHYLLSSPPGRSQLSAFVKQLERGVPSEQAQPAAFGRSADRLGEELAAHVAHLARGVPIETLFDADTFAVPDPPRAVALDAGEVAYALGTLALGIIEAGGVEAWARGPRQARDFLGMALAEHAPDAPRVEAAFEEARALNGDAEDAFAAAQTALARAPHDPRVGLRVARIALLRAEAKDAAGASAAFSEAEEHFLRVVALDPESASAWFGLGQTRMRMGRSGDAFTAFETARRFGWSERLDIALARLHLERGERERAADLLRPIAQNPHGGPAQKEAAELLEGDAP